MSGALLSLVMNGVIILLLITTIVYSARLSRSIRAFKDSKKDMRRLLADLGVQIRKADESIAGMRNAARDAGKELQTRINDSKALRDELEVMAQSGNAVASRIEKAVDRTPHAQSQPERAQRPPQSQPARALAAEQPQLAAKPGLLRRRPKETKRPVSKSETDGSRHESQAERELYEALNKRREPEIGDYS